MPNGNDAVAIEMFSRTYRLDNAEQCASCLSALDKLAAAIDEQVTFPNTLTRPLWPNVKDGAFNARFGTGAEAVVHQVIKAEAGNVDTDPWNLWATAFEPADRDRLVEARRNGRTDVDYQVTLRADLRDKLRAMVQEYRLAVEEAERQLS